MMEQAEHHCLWEDHMQREGSRFLTGEKLKNFIVTVDGLHPVLTCTSLPFLTRAASILSSAISLTMTAHRRFPSLFESRCLSSVVLPAPRKPLSSVTGSFFASAMPSPSSVTYQHKVKHINQPTLVCVFHGMYLCAYPLSPENPKSTRNAVPSFALTCILDVLCCILCYTLHCCFTSNIVWRLAVAAARRLL